MPRGTNARLRARCACMRLRPRNMRASDSESALFRPLGPNRTYPGAIENEGGGPRRANRRPERSAVIAVMFNVKFARFGRMVRRVRAVTGCRVSMMYGGFGVVVLVMLRRFAVMMCRPFVMFGSIMMMFADRMLVRHGFRPLIVAAATTASARALDSRFAKQTCQTRFGDNPFRRHDQTTWLIKTGFIKLSRACREIPLAHAPRCNRRVHLRPNWVTLPRRRLELMARNGDSTLCSAYRSERAVAGSRGTVPIQENRP
jgi:hypothetical protein